MSRVYRPLTMQGGVEGKECAICGEWKSRDNYCKGHYDGLDHRCNDCRKVKREAKRETPLGDVPRPTGFAILRYEGSEIAFEVDRTQASLTDMWIAADQPKNQEPWRWLDQEQPKALLAQYASEHGNLMLDKVCTSRQGAHGGTWAPREIALAYAMYLNPALALAVLRFVLERSDEFIAGSKGATPDQAWALMQRLMAPIYRRLGILELLPGMNIKLDGLGGKIDDIGDRIKNEPERWVGQNYIIEITNPHMLVLLWRKFAYIPDGKDRLIAVGRTGPSGDVYELRLKDLLGKIDLEPGDYNILAHFGSPCPDDTETLTLNSPMLGCVRLKLKNGKPSLTFIAADHQGVQEYKHLGSGGYYTLESLGRMLPQPIVTPPPQEDFYGALGL